MQRFDGLHFLKYIYRPIAYISQQNCWSSLVAATNRNIYEHAQYLRMTSAHLKQVVNVADGSNAIVGLTRDKA